MIRYDMSLAEIEDKIRNDPEVRRDWLDEAARRTAQFEANDSFQEKSSIWSEVKPIYMRFQGDCKCAYCERKMESITYGKVEQDVEHFRPKGNVRPWKLPKALKNAGVVLTEPGEHTGYYLLPYHLYNYAAACKPCNSALKRDYFPIAGTYVEGKDAKDPGLLSAELPYLIYPIGSIDDDPAALIEFIGVSPTPVADTGQQRKRALVTIEFFKLDDPLGRKNLLRDRARTIIALFPQLENLASPNPATKARAERIVDAYQQPWVEHSNCSRSFCRLYRTDRARAERLCDEATDLITSMS